MSEAVARTPVTAAASKRLVEFPAKSLRFILSDWRITVGVGILLIAAVVTIIGPYVTPYDPDEPNTAIRLQGPSGEHWMGTDRIGRDVFSRILAGLTVSMEVAVGAVGLALVVGTPLGAIGGFLGGPADALIMRLMDGVIAFPSRLLAIALVAATGPSVGMLWFAIAFSSIPRYARIIRSGVLVQKEREYVEAARAIGEKPITILVRYVIPNALPPVMVQVTLNFAYAILVESSLSFLGLGLVPPTISWGRMLSEAQEYLEVAPWLAVFPGLALSILILAFVLIGDALQDRFNPRQRRRAGLWGRSRRPWPSSR